MIGQECGECSSRRTYMENVSEWPERAQTLSRARRVYVELAMRADSPIYGEAWERRARRNDPDAAYWGRMLRPWLALRPSVRLARRFYRRAMLAELLYGKAEAGLPGVPVSLDEGLALQWEARAAEQVALREIIDRAADPALMLSRDLAREEHLWRVVFGPFGHNEWPPVYGRRAALADALSAHPWWRRLPARLFARFP